MTGDEVDRNNNRRVQRAKAVEPNETKEGQPDATGRGWHGDPEGHAEAGRKGGTIVSQNREHMALIGRKGGQAVSQNREHMAAIGRKGGARKGQLVRGNG